MLKKTGLCVLIFIVGGSVWGAGLKREYQFQFEGWKGITPTDICSLLDQVIVMQNAQKKIKHGADPASVSMFEGEIPSPKLQTERTTKSEEASSVEIQALRETTKPREVSAVMIQALQILKDITKEPVPIPPLPSRKIYPADVLVYASIAFDHLGHYLEKKGVKKIGDFSLLRYRYPKGLRPHD